MRHGFARDFPEGAEESEALVAGGSAAAAHRGASSGAIRSFGLFAESFQDACGGAKRPLKLLSGDVAQAPRSQLSQGRGLACRRALPIHRSVL